MNARFSIEPIVGDWYESHGEVFEVIAVDDDEGTVEVQYADGTIAELDVEDWSTRAKAGALHPSDPPEDPQGSFDVDTDGDRAYRYLGSDYQDEAGLRASGIDDLDLFE